MTADHAQLMRNALYEVSPADLDADEPIILDLWKRNLPSHTPREHEARFDWHHRRCPFGPGRVWLLRTVGAGSVVGTAGLGVRRVWVGGDAIRAGIAVDFAVDREHRLLLPALMLQRAVLRSLDEDLDLIYGLPNDAAIKVFERVGYQTLTTLSRYVKVLHVKRFLAARGGVPKVALPLIGAVADTGLRLRSPETRRRVRGRVLKELPAFDGRFDDLWERASAWAGAVGVRTSDFLRWRYTDCPLQTYVTLGSLSPGEDRLFGYLTFYCGADSQVRVADLLTDGSEGVVDDLLAGLALWGRRAGFASVSFEFSGVPGLGDALRRFRFVERELDVQVMVSPGARAVTSDAADRLKGWYFLRGDENVNTR